MKRKKGQMKMTETIAVIFIFFILVMFGLLFFYRYQKISVQEQQEEMLGMRAMDTTLKTLFMPELVCTKGDAEAEENCLDMLKVRYAGNVFSKNKLTYFDVFSYSTIELHEIYPNSSNEWVIYNRPRKNFKGKEKTFFIVALKDESVIEDKTAYGYGYLEVTAYS